MAALGSRIRISLHVSTFFLDLRLPGHAPITVNGRCARGQNKRHKHIKDLCPHYVICHLIDQKKSHGQALSINEIKCILQEVRDLRTWEQLSNYSCFVYMVLHHLGYLVESNRTYFDYQKQRKNLLKLCGIVHRTKRKSEKLSFRKTGTRETAKKLSNRN